MIVGSGASGSWAAKRLAEAGLRIVVLEAGRARTEADDREHLPAYELEYRGRSKEPLAVARPRQSASYGWRSVMTMIGAWHATGISMFSVIEKATGRWVGRLGPWMPDGWPGPEVGWAIVRDCWGRGYATEGSAAAIDWAFDHLGWDRVIHTISPENASSTAVARKLGSRNLGPGRLPPPFEGARIDVWGQSRDEWRARRSRTPAP